MAVIPFGQYRELPAATIGDKIVISASNYHPDRDGEIDLQVGHKPNSSLTTSLTWGS